MLAFACAFVALCAASAADALSTVEAVRSGECVEANVLMRPFVVNIRRAAAAKIIGLGVVAIAGLKLAASNVDLAVAIVAASAAVTARTAYRNDRLHRAVRAQRLNPQLRRFLERDFRERLPPAA